MLARVRDWPDAAPPERQRRTLRRVIAMAEPFHPGLRAWIADQVTGDTRDWEFLASRWWAHRKLWETAYNDTTPIFDPDLPVDRQPRLHGLALPDQVIQKIYHDNATNLMSKVGVKIY